MEWNTERTIKAALLLGAPALLMLLPTRFVAAGPRSCVSHVVFKRRCPGCGTTRALSSVMHGDFRAAIAYNPRVIVVFPLMALLWAREIRLLVTDASR